MQTGVSFPILVNNEGDTLYHPLQSLYKTMNLVDTGRDIANYESFPGFDTSVRPALVSGETGSASLLVDVRINQCAHFFVCRQRMNTLICVGACVRTA